MIADTDDTNIMVQSSSNEILSLDRILKAEQSKREKRDDHRKKATYREVAISAFEEAECNVEHVDVPMQQKYSGKKPIITSRLADTPCTDLGVDGLLKHLNSLLGTSYSETSNLSSLLQSYISNNYDFGTTYSRIRPGWFSHLNTIEHIQRNLEAEDLETRKQVLIDNRILAAMPPRRVWDLYSNRVVPYCFILEEPWAVLHDRVDEKDRVTVLTPINGKEWPVSIPKNVNLNLIRIELLNLGAEYVWLDGLCLRQKDGERDDLLKDEWETDIPTMPNIRRWSEVVVHYSNGLGRVSGRTDLTRHHINVCDSTWFHSAWMVPEVDRRQFEIVAGDPENRRTSQEKPAEYSQLDAEHMGKESICGAHRLFGMLLEMQRRVSTNPVDKIAGLAYVVQSYKVPMYYNSESLEEAWTALVNAMSPLHRGQLLFLFPEPGYAGRRWRPSWEQVMTMRLPVDVPCRSKVYREEETDKDWYEGPCVEKGSVRGFDEGASRSGELIINDRYGTGHPFKIIASHQCRIPETSYTLLGSEASSLDGGPQYWIVGRRLPDQRFEKVSVFEMPDYEDRKRLKGLNVTVKHNFFL